MNRALRKLGALALVLLLAFGNARTQFGYLADSTSRNWHPPLDLLRGIAGEHSSWPVWIGVQDPATPSLVALFTEGHPTWSLSGVDEAPIGNERGSLPMLALNAQLAKFYSRLTFDPGNGSAHHFKRYDPPPGSPAEGVRVILPAGDMTVVNASHAHPASGRIYTAVLADQRNTLVQVDSDLGRVHPPGGTEHVGLWDHEGDFVGWPNGLQAVGRHILFEVLNPVPGSRLLLDYTITPMAGSGISLPPVAVYGAERYAFPVAGIGATRVLSAPITPREIDGRFYIAIDFGAEEQTYPAPRHGLAALYNTQLPDDPRHIVGYARNISLLTPDEVAAQAPPAEIPGVPIGLAAPGLLFSGLTEDGWMADRAWFRLGQPGPSNALHLAGAVPGISRKLLAGSVQILVDGAKVTEFKPVPGNFNFTIPIPETAGPRRVEFVVNGTERLPPPDGRFASIWLGSLALAERNEAPAAIVPAARP